MALLYHISNLYGSAGLNQRFPSIKLTFSEIEKILRIPIDHSFLTDKKELTKYGYRVGKISMKEQTVMFVKTQKDNRME